MKLLLTNDDGTDAPGMEALRRAVASFGESTVITPQHPISGCSHQVTLDRGLALIPTGPQCYMLDGTPADCVRVGVLAAALPSDWVISGINNGGNLGVDIYMSGTVAAVREAALLDKPAIALSQYLALDWQRTAEVAAYVLGELFARPAPVGAYWNVNLPATITKTDRLPELVFCPLDPHPLKVDYKSVDGRFHYRSNYQQRPRRPRCDVDVCFSGKVSITKVYLHGRA